MSPRPLRQIDDLRSDAGRLEALYRDIDRPSAVAVVCHPLPVEGGSLHSKIVFRAARGLEAAGVATIRFNFRGTGASQGIYDAGEGEQRDFEAALRWIIRQHPEAKVMAGGFSFGSWVSTRAGCDLPEIQAMFLIGAPVNKYDMRYLTQCRKPLLFLHGTEDPFGDVDKLSALVENIPDAETVIVSGAGHFFDKELEMVEQTMKEWATRMIEELPAKE